MRKKPPVCLTARFLCITFEAFPLMQTITLYSIKKLSNLLDIEVDHRLTYGQMVVSVYIIK